MDKGSISYLSILSHELKAPLNAIINIAKLIEVNLYETNEVKIKSYLSLIISQALYMKNYISNIIELGRIQTGKAELIVEEFDLVETLHEVVELTKIMIGEKLIQVKTDFPMKRCNIVSDPIKIKQILLNIASNSAKFTKEGYIFFAFEKTIDGIIINIKDTGTGIPNEAINKIFQPFCTVSAEKTCESSGLGLYITKEIVDMLGGSISIESEYGKGTTVSISIPQLSAK